MEINFEQAQVLDSVFEFILNSRYVGTDEDFEQFGERIDHGDLEEDLFDPSYRFLKNRLEFILETGVGDNAPIVLSDGADEVPAIVTIAVVFSFATGSRHTSTNQSLREYIENTKNYDFINYHNLKMELRECWRREGM